MYVLSTAKAELRASAKDRISGALSGLLLLVLTYLILTTINPQLSIFSLDNLKTEETPEPKAEVNPGLYLYNLSGDCPDEKKGAKYTETTGDLGIMKNQAGTANIVHDDENEISYVSILYENTNLWGKCQYIDPNTNCESIDRFASSASVHIYNPSPGDDGVYFFRKACYDKIENEYSNINDLVNSCKKKSDGYLRISNGEIGSGVDDGMYVKKLDDLNFENVPEDQQDCIKYEEDGSCSQGGRQIPSLGGENISSMIINGHYLVVFIYFSPGDTGKGPWTFCQEFPLQEGDVNKIGSQQIKWDKIRNNNKGVIPNYVMIIPVNS
jgi:hypothetical protein